MVSWLPITVADTHDDTIAGVYVCKKLEDIEDVEDNDVDSIENKQGYPVDAGYEAVSGYAGYAAYPAQSDYPAAEYATAGVYQGYPLQNTIDRSA